VWHSSCQPFPPSHGTTRNSWQRSISFPSSSVVRLREWMMERKHVLKRGGHERWINPDTIVGVDLLTMMSDGWELRMRDSPGILLAQPVFR
jgi:hypothetical protein